MSFITFLCPIRNRNIDYLLESLANQTEKDFIFMLIDYGSEDEYIAQYKKNAQKYSFVECIFIENVKEKFWNRSLIINIGLKHIKTKNIFITDADLYFEPDFFSQFKNNFKDNTFYVCVVKRLLSKKDNQLFFEQKTHQTKDTLPEMTAGICASNTSIFIEAGGYDTFFRIWGREDNEFYKTIQKNNIPIEIINFDKSPIYHLWHQLENLDLPEGWLELIHQHEKENLSSIKRNNFLNTNIANYQKNQQLLCLKYPFSYHIAYIYQYWYDLKTGETFYFQQNFDTIIVQKQKKLSFFLSFLNHILKKIGIGYRFIELEKFEKKQMTFKEAKDFIFYFILMQEQNIADYSVVIDEKKLIIEWKMMKK